MSEKGRLVYSIDITFQAVRLETTNSTGIPRYMAVVSCIGRQDTEESVILGIDCQESATIGLVYPIYADTSFKLDGDG